MPSRCKKYRHADDRWESLSTRIESYRPLLAGQGDLALKKIGTNRYWYLRFLLPADEAGRRRHCSLYVGRESDEELVARVGARLEQLRAPKRCLGEIAKCEHLAAMLKRLMQRRTDTLASAHP